MTHSRPQQFRRACMNARHDPASRGQAARRRPVARSRLSAMALSFGVTVLPDPPYTRFLELIQLAERNGFEYGWTYDSHVLWHDAYPLLTLLAVNTDKLKFGHCVTNPGTREPTVTASAYATLHAISDGRAVLGIGRGDSARRVIGQQPV